MFTNEEMTAVAGALADQAEALLAGHEKRVHGGVMCHNNRAGFIAFLAHRLGVTGRVWLYAEACLRDYNAHCPGRDGGCPHG